MQPVCVITHQVVCLVEQKDSRFPGAVCRGVSRRHGAKTAAHAPLHIANGLTQLWVDEIVVWEESDLRGLAAQNDKSDRCKDGVNRGS